MIQFGDGRADIQGNSDPACAPDAVHHRDIVRAGGQEEGDPLFRQILRAVQQSGGKAVRKAVERSIGDAALTIDQGDPVVVPLQKREAVCRHDPLVSTAICKPRLS